MKPETASSEPAKTEPLETRWRLIGWVGRVAEPWIGLTLCAAVVLAWVVGHLVPSQATYAQAFAPDSLPLIAAGFAAIGLMPLQGPTQRLPAQRVVRWGGLLLMVWTANGLPLDVFRVVGLIPLGVDWPGLVLRTMALATAVVLARPALVDPAVPPSTLPSAWYGYAAFALALPYPVLRTHWALGGTLGLLWPGAAGAGFVPWLASIPWLVAAGLSLFLVYPPRWMPRRLLLVGGWSATAIVGMIGPAACWALVVGVISGVGVATGGIELWVFALFYGSWLLWAIAAALATRSYQVRCAPARTRSPM